MKIFRVAAVWHQESVKTCEAVGKVMSDGTKISVLKKVADFVPRERHENGGLVVHDRWHGSSTLKFFGIEQAFNDQSLAVG